MRSDNQAGSGWESPPTPTRPIFLSGHDAINRNRCRTVPRRPLSLLFVEGLGSSLK